MSTPYGVEGMTLDVSTFVAELCSELMEMLHEHTGLFTDILALIEAAVAILSHPTCLDKHRKVQNTHTAA